MKKINTFVIVGPDPLTINRLLTANAGWELHGPAHIVVTNDKVRVYQPMIQYIDIVETEEQIRKDTKDHQRRMGIVNDEIAKLDAAVASQSKSKKVKGEQA